MAPARSAWSRRAYTALGLLSLATGIVGVFVPLLPTTCFVLLAAACFAKGSPRLHAWLRAHPWFGAAVCDWEAHRSMPLRAKRWAVGLIGLTMGPTVLFWVHNPWVKGGLALFAVGLIAWILRVPTSAPRAVDARP